MNLPADCLKSVVLSGSIPFDLSSFLASIGSSAGALGVTLAWFHLDLNLDLDLDLLLCEDEYRSRLGQHGYVCIATA